MSQPIQFANHKRLVFNTVMLYVRMLLMMGINLFTTRIVLAALGVNDYALYSVVGSIVVFLGFVNTSMAGASQRFLSYAQASDGKHKLSATFSSILAVQVFLGIGVVVIAELCGPYYINNYLRIASERVATAHLVFQLTLATFVLKTIGVVYTASILSKERMDAFALLSVLEGIFNLGVAFAISLINSNRVVYYACLLLLVAIIIQLSYAIYARKHFEECRLRMNWDKEIIKQILKYSGWNLLGTLSAVGLDQGINLVLNSFFGLVINAARGIAVQVGSAVSGFALNFQQALNPQIVKTYAAGQLREMHILITNGTRFCYYLMLLIFAPLLMNMQSILGWWLTDVPPMTTQFCQLVLVNCLINTLSGCLLTGAMATGKIRRYQICVATINLLNVPLSIILLHLLPNPYIPMFVMIGLSLAAFFMRLYIVKGLIGLDVRNFLINAFWRPGVISILVMASNIAVYHLMRETINFWFIIGTSFLLTTLLLGSLALNSSERKHVNGYIKCKLGI